jgi:hypothetical protein
LNLIKSRGMRWAGHVARMGKRNAYRILVGKRKERDQWKDQDVGGWTVLNTCHLFSVSASQRALERNHKEGTKKRGVVLCARTSFV